MRGFNTKAFVLLAIASLFTDLFRLGLNIARKEKVFPRNFDEFFSYLDVAPWQHALFALLFALAASLAFKISAKVRFDEIVGFVLICPLVQFIIPFLAGAANPYLELWDLPVYPFINFFNAFFLALLARGILGLEELDAFKIVFIGLLAAGLSLLPAISFLPIQPVQLWYFWIGGTMGFLCARRMH